jgi:nitroimidazol reductase NimA-like FMN-containing flavoprotein (pyridoxamine 5'-phosphate oxidase superfamily)
MKSEAEVCVTVTLVDGLVVARSAFHNSMNYRSVVVFGTPRIVEDRDEKLAALELLTDRLIPGRWAESRPVLEKEIKGTLVVALPLDEASAKVRTGGPIDDEGDYDFPVWAGVIPLRLAAGDPIDDYRLLEGIEPPATVVAYRR